jgi:positive regulator of sigma E activity
MIWELFYNFILSMLETETAGSEWATLSSDILALLITLLILYMLIMFPIQLFIRGVIRWVAIITGTPVFYSFRRKYNKKPKYSKQELIDMGEE